MPSTTLTSKGQVTIPSEIREALNLKPGDRLVIDLTEEGFTARVERAPKVQDVRGIFRSAAKPGATREQERAAFHEAAARKSTR